MPEERHGRPLQLFSSRCYRRPSLLKAAVAVFHRTSGALNEYQRLLTALGTLLE